MNPIASIAAAVAGAGALVALAQDPKCEKNLQPFANRCISQRMADYITCVEISGANRVQLIEVLTKADDQKTSVGVGVEGRGPVVKGKASVNVQRATEDVFRKHVETKWGEKSMVHCREVLDAPNKSKPRAQLDYLRRVDFSQLACLPNLARNDVVVFSDVVTFVGPSVPHTYARDISVSKDADLIVKDLVSGEQYRPTLEPGGTEKRGSANFMVDKKKRQARIEWTYRDAYSEDSEGVGFTSSNPYLLRSVDVSYVFPPAVEPTNRRLQPDGLEKRCTRKSAGFRCENLNSDLTFREIWTWNAWKNCPRPSNTAAAQRLH